MTSAAGAWIVRLATAADRDLEEIFAYTVYQFGEPQAPVYAGRLSAALQTLVAGPTVSGVRARGEIARGLYSLHVGRRGSPGRHFLIFRVGAEWVPRLIEVLRLLYDGMDLVRHVGPSDTTPTHKGVGTNGRRRLRRLHERRAMRA